MRMNMEIFGFDTFEAMRRMSRRHYALAALATLAALVPMLILLTDIPVFAENKPLVSKEGENKTADQAAARAVKAITAGSKFHLPDLSKEDQKLEGGLKTIKGTVSAIGPLGIAVSYEKDLKTASEKEIWFNFHSQMKLEGAKTLLDFGAGDTVSVSYLDWVESEKQGAADVTVSGKKIMKELKLIRKAPKEAEPSDEESDE